MGFGFNLGMILIILPITGILLLIWLISKKAIFGKIVLGIWSLIVLLVIVGSFSNRVLKKKELSKSDYYGEYIIDRDYFSGKQADWQYNHFRFKILSNDSIYFYSTENQNILKTYKGTITTVKPFNSERLVIKMKQPTNHILTTNPTIYRETLSFFMVFNSPKFHNMYFKKGKWKPIE